MQETKVLSFGQALAYALTQAMETDGTVFAYGQGINDPGGFFGSTEGIADRFGKDRCFDVPLSEETLAGMGVGAALLGQRPIYVALRIDFLLLSMNQIINHAAKMPLMCGYQVNVPFTIRCIIGREWGQAAQHSGAYHTLFSHVPNLEVVMPSNVKDAAGLLLASIFSDKPTIFIEAKPLYELKDQLQLPVAPVKIGEASIVRRGDDITFVAVSYMVSFAQCIAAELAQRGINAEVVDLRTISPLDQLCVLQSISKTRRVAVFDVGWEPYGLTAEIARIVCTSHECRLAAPLVSIAEKWEHTPGGCFLESQHYPSVKDALAKILALFQPGVPRLK